MPLDSMFKRSPAIELELARGDNDAITALYNFLKARYTGLLRSRLFNDDIDDLLHECLLIVLNTLQTGRLRDPEALEGYIGAVIRRLIAARIVGRIKQRRRLVASEQVVLRNTGRDPEAQVLRRESEALFAEGLGGLRRRDSEILYRFYIAEQSHKRICDEMGLTETQFRLLKSRAKAKLTNWASKRTVNPPVAPALEHLPKTAA